MLKIRLKRVGRKHDPSFRVVVVESVKGPKSGNYIETLGNYDARSDKKTVDAERVKYWLGVGARPSDTVHNILVGEGVISGKKINVLPKKSPIKKDAPEEPEKVLAGEAESENPAGPEGAVAPEPDGQAPAEEFKSNEVGESESSAEAES